MLKLHYASPYSIRLIKSMSREQLERYALEMFDLYLHQKRLTHLEGEKLRWCIMNDYECLG